MPWKGGLAAAGAARDAGAAPDAVAAPDTAARDAALDEPAASGGLGTGTAPGGLRSHIAVHWAGAWLKG